MFVNVAVVCDVHKVERVPSVERAVDGGDDGRRVEENDGGVAGEGEGGGEQVRRGREEDNFKRHVIAAGNNAHDDPALSCQRLFE